MRPDDKRPTTAREYLVGGTALAAAMVINQYAGRMADAAGEAAGTSPDLLLGWLPHWDTSILFIYGFTFFLLWLIYILTPMRTPPDHAVVAGDPLFAIFGRFLTFKHDLFFSSHTATPFLAFLLFRGPWVRRSFLAISLLMAATVLVGRLHYSIDVFAAFFITFSLHKLEAQKIQHVYELLTGIRRD